MYNVYRRSHSRPPARRRPRLKRISKFAAHSLQPASALGCLAAGARMGGSVDCGDCASPVLGIIVVVAGSVAGLFCQLRLQDRATRASRLTSTTGAATLGQSLIGPGETSLNAAGEKLLPEKAKPTRLQSLDAVRGLNVMLMILADNSVSINQSWIDHSPWDDVHLADWVMPLFLFMVGVSMAFSTQKYSGPGLKWKVLSRTLKLFVIGCLTQGANIQMNGEGVDLQSMRLPGILQRIAFAYGVVSLMKLGLPVWTVAGLRRPYPGSFEDAPAPSSSRHLRVFLHYAAHWAVALSFLFAHICIMLFLYGAETSFFGVILY